MQYKALKTKARFIIICAALCFVLIMVAGFSHYTLLPMLAACVLLGSILGVATYLWRQSSEPPNKNLRRNVFFIILSTLTCLAFALVFWFDSGWVAPSAIMTGCIIGSATRIL